MPHWWSEANPPFALNLVAREGPDKKRHMLKCTKGFEWLLYTSSWAAHSHNDPLVLLRQLLEAIVPSCYTLFGQRHHLDLLLHDNDYNMEKTFIHAVWLLCRWMQRGWIPEDKGIWDWPPQVPAALS